MLTVVHDQESSNENAREAGRSLLDEIVRDGAQQMLTAALLAEVAAYIEQFGDQVDEAGRTMRDIVASTHRVSALVDVISTASAEQSAGVAQVSLEVSRMDRSTQENAALVEQGAAAAANLKAKAHELVASVAAFRL